ncbi:ABC transporter ATP-binding protein [Ammoniphilus sp. YIM 78166]|uniref:ABC transporter ATP-binding protein n=1 Tax=Ammoniphilus sp. YIM 78166 TaxID=1644106 RepID=UPI00106F9664|nr:ABC transporter ATP-binding protein [Ammoniphilus sp. YIM 78166]
MIRLSGITKEVTQGGTPVSILQSIDLHIAAGEFISIMGPSGSGKSTLLNILGLLDEPSSGEYSFEGSQVNNLSSNKQAMFRNDRIGFVFQSFMLIPRMSVKENVILPLLYTNVSRRERNNRMEEALKQVGMLEKAKEPIINLSGGQKQKVAIARAIVTDPDLILADEPTGNLDQKSKEDVLQIFKSLHQRGKTVVLVTHDLEVAQVAQRVMTMRNGQWLEPNLKQKVGSVR